MKYIPILLLTILFSCNPCKIGRKLNEKEQLIQGRWTCIKMMKGEKEVNFMKEVGEILIKFNCDQYSMSMGGEERTFTFTIEDKTVKFVDVKNYPNLEVISIARNKNTGSLVFSQYYPSFDYNIVWEFKRLTEDQK